MTDVVSLDTLIYQLYTLLPPINPSIWLELKYTHEFILDNKLKLVNEADCVLRQYIVDNEIEYGKRVFTISHDEFVNNIIKVFKIDYKNLCNIFWYTYGNVLATRYKNLLIEISNVDNFSYYGKNLKFKLPPCLKNFIIVCQKRKNTNDINKLIKQLKQL